MKENFSTCLNLILKHEGGFVNHPDDPGGATNMGITKAVYEKHLKRKVSLEEMKNIDKDAVHEIYKKSYWDKLKGDKLPSGLDLFLFDWGVNSGVARSARCLQGILEVSKDGIIGSQTLKRLEREDDSIILSQLHAEREAFYRYLPHFITFGRGWLRRNDETLKESEKLMGEE